VFVSVYFILHFYIKEPGSAEVQLATFERYIQEIKNSNRLNQSNTNKELTAIKSSLAKAEGKLGPLQVIF